MTGASLHALIERAGNLYYYSNLSIAWNADAAEGDRIVELRFADGRELSDEAVYTLGLSDFLAEGGGGLNMLAAIPREPIGLTMLDATVNHLQALAQPVRLPQDRRVTRFAPR